LNGDYSRLSWYRSCGRFRRDIPEQGRYAIGMIHPISLKEVQHLLHVQGIVLKGLNERLDQFNGMCRVE
jgi:hypothetical protein